MDESQGAHSIVQQATGKDEATGPEVLAGLIADLHEGIEEGATE